MSSTCRYNVILADPPWSYREMGCGLERGAPDARHYETMPLAEIASLRVRDFAARDAALFLWTTSMHLPYAFGIIEAWGFRYSSLAFNWTKLNRFGLPWMGMGGYTRRCSELCLLGVRGHPKRIARNVQEAIWAPRREHSRKPDEQYERIEALFAGPYLELFARQMRPGWTVWGNDVARFTPAERRASA